MNRKILGESKSVAELLKMISRVAPTKTNILVVGESGTGKELIARMIHNSGPLKDEAFVPINCGAIPENLIESEMFGHKRGSFTGAVGDKPGLFETADGGTLFLDEVGELPIGMQVKLLRAIQERCFRKVGGNEDIHVDVRIIAATNRDLEAAVARGTFREDLYYRLNVIMIKAPALRDRKGDIALLAKAFLVRFAEKFGKKVMSSSPEVLAALEAHPWPGNIRELENVIERAVTLENGTTVTVASLPPGVAAATVRADLGGMLTVAGDGALGGGVAGAGVMGGGVTGAGAMGGGARELRLPAPDFSKGPLDLDKILGDVERTYLNAAIETAGGVKKKAASLLGITFRSIRYRLKKLGVDPGSDSDSEE